MTRNSTGSDPLGKSRILYEEYIARGLNLILNPDDKEFGAHKTLDHHLSVGADALRLTVGALARA